MKNQDIIPARTVIGFGERKFSIYPDEITPFLINCNDIGLSSVKDIAAVIEQLPANDTASQIVKDEVVLMIKGLIYEGV